MKKEQAESSSLTFIILYLLYALNNLKLTFLWL